MAYFFFSSRRRHTRFSRDWSSDVCSSDLHAIIGLRDCGGGEGVGLHDVRAGFGVGVVDILDGLWLGKDEQVVVALLMTGAAGERSEERRVGKESRFRWVQIRSR